MSQNEIIADEKLSFYHPTEEKFNIASHGFGFFLSFLGLILMLSAAASYGGNWRIVSALVYGVSLMILYAASTLYHSAKKPTRRYKLRILDHAAIYVSIAGAYTPYCILILPRYFGWTLLAFVWTIALIGIVLKLFFTGKYNKISTVAYVVMGWLGVFTLKPIIEAVDIECVLLIILSGVLYTIGAILYSLKSMKFNHAIFHVFVLLGSFTHYLSVFLYVLPYRGSQI